MGAMQNHVGQQSVHVRDHDQCIRDVVGACNRVEVHQRQSECVGVSGKGEYYCRYMVEGVGEW